MEIEQIVKRLEIIEAKLNIQNIEPDLGVYKKKEVLKKMKSLRRKGATYKEIADALNKNKIPTFSNNGRWFAQTIHRLIGG